MDRESQPEPKPVEAAPKSPAEPTEHVAPTPTTEAPGAVAAATDEIAASAPEPEPVTVLEEPTKPEPETVSDSQRGEVQPEPEQETPPDESSKPETEQTDSFAALPPFTERKRRQSVTETQAPSAEVEKPVVPPSRRRVWLRRIALVAAVLIAWPIVATLIYALIPPPVSNLMLFRVATGNGITKTWMPLDQMSKHLPRAVITSEDARFCSHSGVDWVEFGEIIEDAFDDDEGAIRGASTISMQTAKNLFLWEGRGVIGAARKVLEMPLALWMDFVWSKQRMLEIYLNIVEWAPGVYGAEAASQHHFKKPASKLTRREAALLAAVLPNPIKRKAGKPSRRVRQGADRIIIRSAGMGPYLTCLNP